MFINTNNAVRYAFKFNGGELKESADGTIEHTFTKKGTNTYAVLVIWTFLVIEKCNVEYTVLTHCKDTVNHILRDSFLQVII